MNAIQYISIKNIYISTHRFWTIKDEPKISKPKRY